MFEQPRNRAVAEQFHDTPPLNFHKKGTKLSLSGPHDGEQRGDTVGQGHRIRLPHRFAVHTPRLPMIERMFITRSG